MIKKYVFLIIAGLFLISFSAQAAIITQVRYVKMAWNDRPSTAYMYDENFNRLPSHPRHPNTSMDDFSSQGPLWLLAAQIDAVRRLPDGRVEVMNDDPRYTRMNHHAVLAYVSPNKPPTEFFVDGQRVYAVGQEFTDIVFPEGYAFKIDDGYTYVWNWHWHNFGGLPESEDVYIRFTNVYDNDPDAPYRDLNVFWYDAVPIRSEFCVDRGPFSEPRTYNGFRWPVLERRKVVVVGAHMHDHAQGMQFVRNGEVLHTFEGGFDNIPSYHQSHAGCDSYPWSQHPGNLVAKTIESWVPDPEVILEPGDTVVSRSFYTNPHDGTLDAMAILVVYYEVLR